MDACGIEQAIFQASLYYQSSREGLEARVQEHFDLVKFPGRFLHATTLLPPQQGPATFYHLMEIPGFCKTTWNATESGVYTSCLAHGYSPE